ncbi:MAG: phosphoribosylglycinamide formyltransferase, partial [Caldilineaceae bacterium]|nr:phosphoribosylglycinamide formyltransferase [Caldilineaceae bacterium]
GEVKETGVMVHLVPDEKVDAGPVIETTTVPIYPRDTLEALTQRVHNAEYPTLVRALLRLIEGD